MTCLLAPASIYMHAGGCLRLTATADRPSSQSIAAKTSDRDWKHDARSQSRSAADRRLGAKQMQLPRQLMASCRTALLAT
jgi:hypothetical protein